MGVLLSLGLWTFPLHLNETVTIFLAESSSMVGRSGYRGHDGWSRPRESHHLIDEVNMSGSRSIYRYRARRTNAKAVGNTILNALSNCPSRIVRPITVS
jgi:hypothetical protein